jgi:hypothetical protein
MDKRLMIIPIDKIAPTKGRIYYLTKRPTVVYDARKIDKVFALVERRIERNKIVDSHIEQRDRD